MTAPKSIIVDETLAKRFWPGQDPIGRRMYMPTAVLGIVTWVLAIVAGLACALPARRATRIDPIVALAA